MAQIYSAPMYAMGASEASEQAKAQAALASMRRSLRGWLKYRKILDDYAAGRAKAAPLRNPGAKPMPRGVVAATLSKNRFPYEQDLATTLYHLLVESGLDASQLPPPDVSADPNAAVRLAQIALSGKAPSEVSSPQAQGFWWLIAIPVAGAVLVLSQMITSKADVAKEQARLECIKNGACTDSGFWLKVASVSIIAWIAWDKMGLREAISKKR